MSNDGDHIMRVLRDCEDTLRTSADGGRLSEDALAAFAKLASAVRAEKDRRSGRDRRGTRRDSNDRRADVHARASAIALT